MNKNAVIVITGAAGFIGSCLVAYLNEQGFTNLILVDDFSRDDKLPNLKGKKWLQQIHREIFFNEISSLDYKIDFIFHLGARTDTTEFDYAVHQKWNLDYSIQVWKYCTAHHVPLVYASSAASYGDGEFGYHDNHEIVSRLKPLNPYGISKNEFDKWALVQKDSPPFWTGLKFFNVYGPNEYHKARMASVIFHSVLQIEKQGFVKLFRSHRANYKDGEQLRDFIYVKDVLKVCVWLMENRDRVASGLYNLGTGKARTFYDLVSATFRALQLPVNIQFIDMPEDIREKYQYFTEADMHKLKNAGYPHPFYSLEEGIQAYVQQYLKHRNYY